ncbi:MULTISPECIES: RGCVC family protein [Kutzneria]|uniref:RGCVC family protein n=1 Tax=Kutzneria TaxID=43356 RepID=UPI0030846B49
MSVRIAGPRPPGARAPRCVRCPGRRRSPETPVGGAPRLRRPEDNGVVTESVHFRLLTRPADGNWRQVLAESLRTSADTTSAPTACPVCPHPPDTHDEIGVRYCVATAAGKFERGCVCVTGESAR